METPNEEIPAQLLADKLAALPGEAAALASDSKLYLECLGRPLKDRTTLKDIRDGLILYWHVYRVIRPEPEKPKQTKPTTKSNSTI